MTGAFVINDGLDHGGGVFYEIKAISASRMRLSIETCTDEEEGEECPSEEVVWNKCPLS